MTWYTKDKTLAEEERAAEIKHIKELEEDALSVALCVYRSFDLGQDLTIEQGVHSGCARAIGTFDLDWSATAHG